MKEFELGADMKILLVKYKDRFHALSGKCTHYGFPLVKGPSSLSCAETLRKEGFDGRIVVASKEPDLTYDRPKTLDCTGESLRLRSPEFMKEYDIEFLTEHQATSMDMSSKTVTFSNGTSVIYDKLLIASGGSPRLLSCPGSDLSGVFYLRTPHNVNSIGDAATGKNVVVIGSSFIGMEIAGQRADTDDSPMRAVSKLFNSKGVKFIPRSGISKIVGADGNMTGVVLVDGTEMEADVCVAGIGVLPSTDFVDKSLLTDRGFVSVTDRMQSATDDNVFAAGDIASFPLWCANGKTVAIGHWQLALAHGRQAALSMLGRSTDFASVPFFWCLLFGKSVRYAGYSTDHDESIVVGEPAQFDCTVYYCKGDVVQAIACMGNINVMKAVEFWKAGKTITKEQAKENRWLTEYSELQKA